MSGHAFVPAAGSVGICAECGRAEESHESDPARTWAVTVWDDHASFTDDWYPDPPTDEEVEKMIVEDGALGVAIQPPGWEPEQEYRVAVRSVRWETDSR